MAISAACKSAKTVNKKRNRDMDDMSSSLFMGATGPFGPPAATIATAESGDFVRPMMMRKSGGIMESNLLRSGNVRVIFCKLFWIRVGCFVTLRVGLRT